MCFCSSFSEKVNDVSLCDTFAYCSVSWTKCLLSFWLKSILNISSGILPSHWSYKILKLVCSVYSRFCFHTRILMSLSFSDACQLCVVSKFSADFRSWSTFSSFADASSELEITLYFLHSTFTTCLGNLPFFTFLSPFFVLLVACCDVCIQYTLSLPFNVLIVFLQCLHHCRLLSWCHCLQDFQVVTKLHQYHLPPAPPAHLNDWKGVYIHVVLQGYQIVQMFQCWICWYILVLFLCFNEFFIVSFDCWFIPI